ARARLRRLARGLPPGGRRSLARLLAAARAALARLPRLLPLAAATRRDARALPPLERHVLALALADVDLARARDLLLGVVAHLEPLRDPPARAPDREHHREHRDGQAERLVDEARVEVDVRVQLARGEVLVV